MTPRRVREALIDQLNLFPGMKVLDPGAGSGEFLASVNNRVPGAELTGCDIDPDVLGYAARNVPQARFENRSAFEPVGEADSTWSSAIHRIFSFGQPPDMSSGL